RLAFHSFPTRRSSDLNRCGQHGKRARKFRAFSMQATGPCPFMLSGMCGIVGYVGRQPALDIAVEALRRMEYRGYDSAGVAVLDGDRKSTRLNSSHVSM